MLLKFKSNIISSKVGYFGAHALQFLYLNSGRLNNIQAG